MSITERLRRRSRQWIRRRQGPDRGRVTLHRGRIYILPTRLGLVFAAMLFAMLLGSLNYSNNLGLGLVFLLASLALVAMHQCHHNLEGLVVGGAGTEPPFAGQPASFRMALHNPSGSARHDLEVEDGMGGTDVLSLAAGEEASAAVKRPTRRRGRVRLERYVVATRHPFGLFRAWAVLHPDAECLVFPRPAANAPPPPLAAAVGSGLDDGRGDEDFAGLKDYHPGDPPRHIAWKALAHSGELLVKEFAGAAEVTPWFDLERTPGSDLETRLEVLTRWVLDAAARGQAFGLRLPGTEISPEPGHAHRQRCLAALAEFEMPETAHG